MKRISIDPITRLEGHGKIEIFLADDGSVANAYFQVPELRGFEKFLEGMPIEEGQRVRVIEVRSGRLIVEGVVESTSAETAEDPLAQPVDWDDLPGNPRENPPS